MFTKLLKVPFSTLRSKGHKNSAYIDDSALFGTTQTSCLQNVKQSAQLLDSLGFTIHPDKSVFYPTQILTYCGGWQLSGPGARRRVRPNLL